MSWMTLVAMGAMAMGTLVSGADGPVLEERHPRQEVVDRMRVEGMRQQGAMALLRRLTEVGPRLGGSPEAEAAVALGVRMMHELGLEEVHLEPVTIRHWVRGTEAARIVGGEPLAAMALGGSAGTPEAGVEAEVIEVLTLEECDALGEKAKGKILFFNRPMDPTHVNTFQAYGGAADQRVHSASRAARVGAVAVLVRSMTMRHDDVPHTGIMKYAEDAPEIPAAALSLVAADRLHAALEKGPVRVHLQLGCRSLDPVVSHNVVGQITGTERPDEVIVVGGHLDSWDAGTGAHDDGAGCMQSLEALRIIKALGLTPKRTLRAVLFMDEEFGGTGGRAYAVDERRKRERHIAAIESDRGGFLPLGFTVFGDEARVAAFQPWVPLLESLGLYWIRSGYGGVDIHPLSEQGTVTIGLFPDSQRYFDVHHCANDVIEAVNPRELELGAIAMAALAWLLSEEGVPGP